MIFGRQNQHKQNNVKCTAIQKIMEWRLLNQSGEMDSTTYLLVGSLHGWEMLNIDAAA
jgi:hypothetical protein